MPLYVPVFEQIIKAMEVAQTSTEAADYLVVKIKERFTDAKVLEQNKELLVHVEEFGENVALKVVKSNQAWFGQEAKGTDYDNMQENIAKKSVDALKAADIQEHLHLDLAINDNAQLLRGYSHNGQALSNPEEADKLFNAWLAIHDVKSLSSVLYQADKNGEVLAAQGNIAANVARIRQLVNDPQQGFGKFMQEKGIPVTIQQHDYPSQTKTEQVEQQVEQEAKSNLGT
ncbi:MAG: hypothetical protein ACHP65_05840 [Legionellales bacterium]